jgi:nucleoside phosphorylase
MKLLVVAAWEPELERFRERLGAASPAGGLEVVLDTLGVGVVDAAIATTRCVVRHRPAAVLLLGTCGAFAAELLAGTVVVGADARLVDSAVTQGSAALPGPMAAHASFDVALHDALVAAGARSVQIANTVGITTDDALAAHLAEASAAAVEHLEAFGLARACALADLPCATVLAVANAVGSKGRAEWLASHVRASAAAADHPDDSLGAIAAALDVRTTTTARSPERA